jgi:hypothetical protein
MAIPKGPKYFRAGMNMAESPATSFYGIRQPKFIQESDENFVLSPHARNSSGPVS